MLDRSPANSGNCSGGSTSAVRANAPASSTGLSATAGPPNVAVVPVIDAADGVAELPVELRGLAGVGQLAALVEVVAHGERQVLLALGDREVAEVARGYL